MVFYEGSRLQPQKFRFSKGQGKGDDNAGVGQRALVCPDVKLACFPRKQELKYPINDREAEGLGHQVTEPRAQPSRRCVNSFSGSIVTSGDGRAHCTDAFLLTCVHVQALGRYEREATLKGGCFNNSIIILS